MSTRSKVLTALFLLLLCMHFSTFAEDSQWIWTTEAASPVAGERFFRRVFALGRTPAKAMLTISCDGQYEVYLNGKLAGAGNEWRLPGVFDVAPLLVRGTNVIAVKGAKDIPGAAGLILDLDCGSEFHLISNKNWRWYKTEVGGWMQSGFDAEAWKPAQRLAVRTPRRGN